MLDMLLAVSRLRPDAKMVCVCVVDAYLCLFLVLFSTVFREIERSESLNFTLLTRPHAIP